MSPAKKLGKRKGAHRREEPARAKPAGPGASERYTEAPRKRVNPPYTKGLAEEICQRIANGASYATILRDPHFDFPDWATLTRWREKHEDFGKAYLRAKAMQLEYWAEQVVDVADHTEVGIRTKTEKWGESVTTEDMLEHRKLKVDSRKWMLAKLARAVYGERLAHTGADDGPIGLKLETKDDLIASIIGLVKPKKDGIEKPNKGKREK